MITCAVLVWDTLGIFLEDKFNHVFQMLGSCIHAITFWMWC